MTEDNIMVILLGILFLGILFLGTQLTIRGRKGQVVFQYTGILLLLIEALIDAFKKL